MAQVTSERRLSVKELRQIADIMKHSECPNESLANSISGYAGITDDTIRIGEKDNFKYEI